MNPQLDLYGNIGEIRDALEVLLKRGKPVSVADLQTLVTTVQAQSRPTISLPAEEVAKRLAPALLAQLPTPDKLLAAGQQTAAQLEAALAAGAAASTRQVTASIQQGVQQLTQAAATLTQAAERMPRSVEVDFIRGWGYVAALMLGPVSLLLLVLWGMGAFSGVAQAKYDQLSESAQAVLQERDYYQQQIERFRKSMSTTKEFRRTTQQLFPPYTPAPPAAQP